MRPPRLATGTLDRPDFEEFLLKQKQLVNQVTLKYGSGLKGYRRLSELYKLILDLVVARSSEESIITAIKTDERFKDYIQLDNEADGEAVTKDFSIGTKSAAFLRDALSAPIKCKICHGLIHMNSITFDHIQRKEDGGIGNIENAQLAHPYCNNILKN